MMNKIVWIYNKSWIYCWLAQYETIRNILVLKTKFNFEYWQCTMIEYSERPEIWIVDFFHQFRSRKQNILETKIKQLSRDRKCVGILILNQLSSVYQDLHSSNHLTLCLEFPLLNFSDTVSLITMTRQILISLVYRW